MLFSYLDVLFTNYHILYLKLIPEYNETEQNVHNIASKERVLFFFFLVSLGFSSYDNVNYYRTI